jgi:hypothetical protein
MTNQAVLKRGGSNPMLYLILVTLLGLIVWAITTVATNQGQTCEWPTGCKKPAIMRLSNPSSGRVAYYCAEHAMQQMNKGWVSSPKP